MKKILLSSLAVYAFSQDTHALENTYLKMSFGYAFTNNPSSITAQADNKPMFGTNEKIRNQVSLGIAAGLRVLDNLRTELSLEFRPRTKFSLVDNVPEIGVGHFTNMTLMFNTYYDHNIYDSTKAYLIAGLGWSRNQTTRIYWPVVNQHEGGKSVNKLAWALGAGLVYKVTEKWDIDFGYRLINIGGLKNTGQYDDNTSGEPTKWKMFITIPLWQE